ncbi:MFS transporter [Kutzneria albida]|uniref:Major facilitator transporter n=1 Tax=Kutzneria albida DSM 43870 TaxID=1449976 RepID=W5VXW7_9PSEU|nr:MFS transporter [Kutzneria albida]AHH93412.1 major facilitator transporter [Kutzneria albida DSM 43870]
MAQAAELDGGPFDDGDRALTEPVTKVRGGWTTLLFLANLGLWLGIYAPIQVLLPEQAELLAHSDKEAVFSLVTGIGAVVALFANPVIGALSDRTCSRLGRRHPWTLLGAALGAVGLLVLAAAPNVPVMVLGWSLVQAGLNGMLASLTAALPDRVPVDQRAEIGGFIGISQMLGTVAGAALVSVVITGISPGYAACAVLVVLGALAFVLCTPDAVLPRRLRPGGRFREVVANLWISPRRHPDFGWGWGTHFMVNFGNALGTLYLLYFLADAVHYPDPTTGLLILMALYGVALIIGALVAGRMSDSSGRRKPYVVASSLVMALAAAVLVVSQSWPAALVAAPLLGVGFGVYWAVALAVLTQVLPAASNRAKDLGVINVANSLPLVIAPVVAGLVLGTTGGYPALFALSAVATLVGGFMVTRIRAVT